LEDISTAFHGSGLSVGEGREGKEGPGLGGACRKKDNKGDGQIRMQKPPE